MKRAQNRLSILKVCTSRSWGGLEMHTVHLCELLRERGYVILPVCYKGSRIDQQLVRAGFKPFYLNVKSYIHPFLIFRLARKIRNSDIDIIHSDYSKDLWTIVPAVRLSKKLPIVLLKHIGTQKPKRDPFHRWIYRNVNQIIAISNVIRENVVNTHPIAPERVSVIHNGISLETFSPSPTDRETARREFSFSADELVIGIIGRLQVGKGYLEFLEMASTISKSFENVKFLIVGEATYGHNAEADMILGKIDEWQLRDKCICTGYREDVPRLLSAMDIFVFPSRAEAFGLVLIEAMAMHLPVIACRSDGVLDVVVENETGLLFTPKNVPELNHAVAELIRHPEKRRLLGDNGFQRVQRLFTDSLMLDRLESLYFSLIKS
ncbi:glycosyltransferase family 4 protein [candidate division KSB1 bacterium]|nr:glycosyltransferase family 4 protein [candidate division KSB1 bacterium]